MWPDTFGDRLTSWNQLRNDTQELPVQQALEQINQWWFQTPWRPYYLHWDDMATWPDPWQLLNENMYCDLARALGILYTITLLNRADLGPADLVLTESGHNLVLVNKTKYILNWVSTSVVNNNPESRIHRRYQQQQIA